MKLLIIIILLSSVNALAKDAPDINADTLIYPDGTMDIGTVIKITDSKVEFKMQSSEVNFEISKSRIKEIRLNNGRIIEFVRDYQDNDDSDTRQRPNADKDSNGPPVALVAFLVSVGVVIITLVWLGNAFRW